jgi:VanZ family protein
MALLFWRPFHDWRPGWPEGKAAAWIFIIIALNGLIDEMHQAIVPGRIASAGDLAADIAGWTIAIGWLLHREKRRMSEREQFLEENVTRN